MLQLGLFQIYGLLEEYLKKDIVCMRFSLLKFRRFKNTICLVSFPLTAQIYKKN